ncbi:MAG: helix-turn-helix transcriptional regulator [Rhodococcus sp. (in: high G+C Gram-positive bacteria)]|uniref:helix-turn-helix transcriptional regulator n=1 Tax=Rhodococcus sp. TaxID=1831 RepID=UPI002AD7273F|nr:helix-turn-helix transcriptional regulator [Rhodococcus sp. (in: high G+C Gram-positive bacteria)]
MGNQVRLARKRLELSQADLAREAGVSKGVIMNLESTKDRVRAAPSIATLIRIAYTLRIPPVLLIYPDMPDGEVEVIPGLTASSIEAAQWFSGESTLGGVDSDDRLEFFTMKGLDLMRFSRERQNSDGVLLAALRALDELGGELAPSQQLMLDTARTKLADLEDRIRSAKGHIAGDIRAEKGDDSDGDGE